MNSDQELLKRQQNINFARGSIALEGFILDEQTEATIARYRAGEISGDEHLNLIMESIKS